MHISVFCGASLPHSEQITEAARQIGRSIARRGHTLLYGGSNLGLIGATSGAALQEGGRVVGVIPTFFSDDIIRSQPVSELVRVRTLAGWIDCYPKSRHAGTLFCGGVTMPRDIAGNHKLQAAYELGKNIQ